MRAKWHQLRTAWRTGWKQGRSGSAPLALLGAAAHLAREAEKVGIPVPKQVQDTLWTLWSLQATQNYLVRREFARNHEPLPPMTEFDDEESGV
jgi:hypothetical protein